MESIGQQFKAAREKKRVSLSQAAIKTKLKVQVLEAMERDDFSKMPAPIYARGFIRTYCDFLGLDSVPLVQEYNDRQGGAAKRPALPDAPLAKVISDTPQTVQPAKPEPARRSPPPSVSSRQIAATGDGNKTFAAVGAVAAIILVVVVAVKFWPARKHDASASAKKNVVEIQRPVTRMAEAIMREPPEPYIATGPQVKKP